MIGLDAAYRHDHSDPGGDGRFRTSSPMFSNTRVVSGFDLVGVGSGAPRELSLAPAQPNRFGGHVAFRFALPQAGPVTLEVFDLLGRRVKSWRWDDLAAGALLYRLSAMGKTITRKAVRLE